MVTPYEWTWRAFIHEGLCPLCRDWTRSGVRRSGRVRWQHLCRDCAQNKFAGEIVSWTDDPQLAAGRGEARP